eukprot:GHVQ01012750.1.p2 GENE.GHVQ01012750.1~~GHVQ01012750.1.p2  ORF type:complete len:101 (-),score=6.78 GHVQ01012750.1:687-989(-)
MTACLHAEALFLLRHVRLFASSEDDLNNPCAQKRTILGHCNASVFIISLAPLINETSTGLFGQCGSDWLQILQQKVSYEGRIPLGSAQARSSRESPRDFL